MNNLEGQVAVISGGLGDIGRAIGLELARRGADLAIGDLKEAPDDPEFLADLKETGRRVRYTRVDVSDAAAVNVWVQSVEEELGVPTLIIPNAAIVTTKSARDVSPDEWGRELQINLSGAFYLAQAGARRLLHHKKPGRIVFTGSWAAHAPHPRIVAYSVAKAGIRMLCQCMALDLAPAGVLVNEVAPGYVDAGLTGRLYQREPERRERALQVVPNGLLIQPEEVALQVAHLCDPANRQMVGATIVVDGGLSLVNPSGVRGPQ